MPGWWLAKPRRETRGILHPRVALIFCFDFPQPCTPPNTAACVSPGLSGRPPLPPATMPKHMPPLLLHCSCMLLSLFPRLSPTHPSPLAGAGLGGCPGGCDQPGPGVPGLLHPALPRLPPGKGSGQQGEESRSWVGRTGCVCGEEHKTGGLSWVGQGLRRVQVCRWIQGNVMCTFHM